MNSNADFPNAPQDASPEKILSPPPTESSIDNSTLLTQVRRAAIQERDATLLLLSLLQETEHRNLHLELGYSSLFEFCVKDLGLSAGSAQRRICAMRFARTQPLVWQKLRTGELTVTNAAKIYSEARKEKSTPVQEREIIEACLSKTQRECEEILQNYFPDSIVATERVRPIGTDSMELTLVLPRATFDKLTLLKNYLAHSNPQGTLLGLVQVLVDAEIGRQEKKRGIVPVSESIQKEPEVTPSNPTSTVETKSHGPVRKPLKRLIYRLAFQRAGNKCQAPGCESSYMLEIDHIIPISRGGTNAPDNLRVLCHAHHRLASVRAGFRTPQVPN